jgi:hypothetical protein
MRARLFVALAGSERCMKLMRSAALVAVPAALLLSACGGGSNSPFVNTAVAKKTQVRFVQGDPKVGALDIYFYQSAGAATTTPASANVPYGEATDYQQQTAVPNTLVARVAGSSPTGPAVASCNLASLSNVSYSVVIADQGGTANCMLFQDQDYSGTAQYRVHHAAADAVAANAALNSVAYGVGTTPAAITVQGTSALGGFTGSANPLTQAGSTGNQANATGTVFGVAPTAATGTTVAPSATLSATSIFAPGTLTQPDTTGALPFSPYVGVSLYALDCLAGGTTSIPCSPGGVALIGVFDTK